MAMHHINGLNISKKEGNAASATDQLTSLWIRLGILFNRRISRARIPPG